MPLRLPFRVRTATALRTPAPRSSHPSTRTHITGFASTPTGSVRCLSTTTTNAASSSFSPTTDPPHTTRRRPQRRGATVSRVNGALPSPAPLLDSAAASPPPPPPRLSDAARRLARLQAALDRLSDFRRWCRAQPSAPHAGHTAPWRDGAIHKKQLSRQRGTAAAAMAGTLADVTGRSAAPSPLPRSLAPLTLMERRLLTHYASLLHDVRQAAAQLPARDFTARVAAAVELALAPPPPPSSPPFPSARAARVARAAFCVLPHSTTWSDADAAAGAGREVVRAEQRLAQWSALWYAEVLQRHATPSPSTLKKEQEREGALMMEEEEDEEEAECDVSQFASLLVRGQWRGVLRQLTTTPLFTSSRTAAAAPITTFTIPTATPTVDALLSPAALRRRCRVWLQPAQRKAKGGGPSAARLPRHAALAPVTPAELRLLVSPPSAGLSVVAEMPAQAPAARSSSGGGITITRGPVDGEQALRDAAAREWAAGRASGSPPSCVVRLRRRLWVLRRLPPHLPPSLVRFADGTATATGVERGGGAAVTPQPYLLRSDGLEKLPWCVLCVLAQALESTQQRINSGPIIASLLSAPSASHEGDRGANSSNNNNHGGGEQSEDLPVLLQAARAQLCHALFLHYSVDYAAASDYVHHLFVSVGSAMTACQVRAAVAAHSAGGGGGPAGRQGSAASAPQPQQEHSDHCACPALVERLFGQTFAQTAIALLRPPALAEYRAAGLAQEAASTACDGTSDRGGGPRRAACESPPASSPGKDRDAAVRCSAGDASAPQAHHDDAPVPPLVAPSSTRIDSKPHSNTAASADPFDVTAVRYVSGSLFEELCAAALSWRNYHTALYCETLSQIADSAGLALDELTRMLAYSSTKIRTDDEGTQRKADGHDDANGAAEAMVVLAPESAAAVATAVLLQRLAQHSPLGNECDAFLPEMLVFAVPHAKAHAVATYFRGTFHADFFRRVCVTPASAASPQDASTAAREASGDVDDADAAAAAGLRFAPSLTLPAVEWEGSALARLVGRSLRRVDRYPTRTTEAFFAAYLRGEDVTAAHGRPSNIDSSHEGAATVVRSDGTAVFAPPLSVDFYVMDLRAAAAAAAGCQGKRSTDKVRLLAAPPQLPCGLHAVYKPAGVNCTLHAHYPTLIFPFLSRQLPWQGGAVTALPSANSATEETREGVEVREAVVPVHRQQGLVNRIDVGTSGVVLLARDAPSLQCASDAMVREHAACKTYRALVQRWPPMMGAANTPPPSLPSSSPSQTAAAAADSGSLFVTAPFLSSLPTAVISAPVYAAGATADAIPRHAANDGDDSKHHSPALSSTDNEAFSLTYTRSHVALHDRRRAVTRYRVLEWFPAAGVAYVHVELDSGRHHQIRQHFAQMGFPLVGDRRYHAGLREGRRGTEEAVATFGMERAALHAYSVRLALQDGGGAGERGEGEGAAAAVGPVVVEAPLPSDMRAALQQLRRQEGPRKPRAS